jgi:DUF1680 family protein
MRLLALLVSIQLGGWCLGDAADISRRDYGIIKTVSSPYAKLKSVDLDSVRWTNGFWADRFDQCRTVTLPRLWELASGPEAGHAWKNMRIAAGLIEGEYSGNDWQDAWLYKWIESSCYMYSVTKDAELLEQMDRIIDVIAKAQQPDGFLACQTMVRGRPRFKDPNHHELYTMGHLITAACAHHRVTGQRNFLKVAIRVADYVYNTFKTGNPAYAEFPRNPSIIMAGAELYRTTGDRQHLDMANFFIDWRGALHKGVKSRDIWVPIKGGSDLNQNFRPLREETEVVGHAVFFTYLYAGAADAYMETGDKTLLNALERLWIDLTKCKMYVTGGVSPMHKSHPARSFSPGTLYLIAGDSIHEGVGVPYDLPNASAYNETCGMIGNMMWNWRMLAITGDARYADIMELSLFNSILSGIEIDGEGWSYTNPLRWHGKEHVLRSHDSHTRSNPGERKICCPTNLLRTVAGLHGYIYNTDDEGLWIHHYGGNTANIALDDGSTINLTQETDYPWEGEIKITLNKVATNEAFKIRVRIPGWCSDASVKVNGKTAAKELHPESYASIEREWNKGDIITIDLPMPVRLLAADNLLEHTVNQTAVKRGPVVYCLESTDLGDGVDIEDICLPADAQWKTRHDAKLLGGVTVLETTAITGAYEKVGSGLYSHLRPSTRRKTPIRMIPYYTWNNRGEPKMTVWIPVN